jgi:NADH:ubiquinone oxidoreductase subunit 5 (subunit L)/multisubunit Na+/H+ antiporter MnhA subunit
VIVAWLVSTFTAFYILKATVGVFFWRRKSTTSSNENKIEDASPRMLAGMGVFGNRLLFFGIVPQALIKWIIEPATWP